MQFFFFFFFLFEHIVFHYFVGKPRYNVNILVFLIVVRYYVENKMITEFMILFFGHVQNLLAMTIKFLSISLHFKRKISNISNFSYFFRCNSTLFGSLAKKKMHFVVKNTYTKVNAEAFFFLRFFG